MSAVARRHPCRFLLAMACALGFAAMLVMAPPVRGQTSAVVPVQAPAADPGDLDRQVLVMLRLPPVRYRPGGSYTEAYGGQLGQRARHALARELADQHRLRVVETWPMPLLGIDCVVLALGPAPADPREPAQVALQLESAEGVSWAQPMHTYRPQSGSADPLFDAQPAAAQWHLSQLHQLATGKGVTVAVVDSGIDATHPDLRGQVVQNQNFVDAQPVPPEWHGTAVAGIIAARSDNGIGIAGVAPEARLVGLRACWQRTPADTVCSTLSLAKALHAALTYDVQVINMSLGGPEDLLLARLLGLALARQIRVVAAVAGPGTGGSFPATLPGVVAVGAGTPLPAGAVQAPGRDVPTTVPADRWALVTGSSYSAAHVSGLLALAFELSGTAYQPLVLAPQSTIDACATLLRQRQAPHSACALTLLAHQSRVD